MSPPLKAASKGGRRIRTVADDPLWYKDAVIYQVHVKSFFDANNDGIGDLQGLTEKLDYIAELGVSAIWLLPFYPSPRRDDGYDIADYRAVHPEYGTIRDTRRFIAAAHKRKLRVITELVINHTSDAHPWFQRARHAKAGSAARKFYVWADDDHGYSDARIIFTDTEKSNWSYDPVAGAYFWHRFYSHQPDLNFDNPRVLEAVLGAMRFWLDLGVDGFRLDAVPYLVEREGTSSENLPETHAIIRRIRAELDRAAPGCMLLAEANQWPEDVQEYFGAGDECHMAFHFPLMPRMYMAIGQEDRFPITDILRQTPEVPQACQWAVFLRNHDELTLEMVTDAERDYLWSTYATDRRARLNLGIRRRLAPLLERDRPLIELMNGLLFSMPGTPVIYYGDEIGMGDNIYLGDRDGVRTPMQWSPDRNGGFSRSDPARLVLPPIMDAIYGYEAVNVEAQARDPHSLLNWTRRMLAVRRRHQAFGRGRLRLLSPGNRKILAFLRELEDENGEETILCVANLSRTAQAVELDLSEFSGRTPVDLLGGSVFPPIGQLTYLLTLPDHAFYWFSLAKDTAMPSWRVPPSEPLPELATLVIRHEITELLAPEPKRMIERDILPPYLARRRWFAQKDRKVHSISIVRDDVIRGRVGDFVAFEIAVAAEGRQDRYLLPVGIVWDDGKLPAIVHQLALGRVRRHRQIGVLTDAFAVDALPAAVLASLAKERVEPLADGEIRWVPTSQEIPAVPPETGIVRLSAEQSNTSLILGDMAVLKIIRRVSAGRHPQTEMMRYLTERGFANSPALLGEIVRVDAKGTPQTLVIVERFVRNQGNAWEWTLDTIRRGIHPAALTGTDDEAGRDAIAAYLPFTAAIGQRLGELHAVLATSSNDPAFAPVRVEAADTKAWAAAANEELEAACKTLGNFTGWRDEGEREAAAALVALREPLAAKTRELAAAGIGTLRTRIHGDFHLGQILVAQGDAILIDYEGEPAKSLEDRRAKGSPLRDVAGLLRSLDYVAATIAREPAPATAPTADRRADLLDHYVTTASVSFLKAYRAAAAAAERKWVPDVRSAEALIQLFLIHKAAYEIGYEAANRPDWIGIPVNGLLKLAKRLLGGKREPREE
jgi:maltose alpha-D-glucosyltransferase/alpha-amylase